MNKDKEDGFACGVAYALGVLCTYDEIDRGYVKTVLGGMTLDDLKKAGAEQSDIRAIRRVLNP